MSAHEKTAMSEQKQLSMNEQLASINIQPIGRVKSPYRQKFAIPRQPGLVAAIEGVIELEGPYANPDLVRDLDEFSHIWVIFIFHATEEDGWTPLVRPPRLGGKVKKGVLATRSTHRPNPLGLSVVKLLRIEQQANKLRLIISGHDLLDGTPVVDIKPYLPYADAHPSASGGFADDRPVTDIAIRFHPDAERELSRLAARYPLFKALISDILSQDPRPAYKKNRPLPQRYGMALYDRNVHWQVDEQGMEVTAIERLNERLLQPAKSDD